MNGQMGNPIFERRRPMDDRSGSFAADLHGLKLRITVAKEHPGDILRSVAGGNGRMDRFDERRTRVERRLALTEIR